MALSITSRQSRDNINSMSEVLSSIDILTLVAQCLANDDLIDLLHFAQVCKTWHQAAAILQGLQRPSMPWLFSLDKSTGTFGLFDFWSSKQNCSHELKISPRLQKFITGSHDDDLYVCTSKHGWLLLSKLVRCSIHTKVEFFFCNPFFNKFMELPWLYLDVGEIVVKSMINGTQQPALAGKDSDDCVIFIMSRGKNYNRIQTCHPRSRNKKWTSHLGFNFMSSTYMNGTLYCLEEFGYETKLRGMLGIANKDSGVVTSTLYSSSSSLQEPEARLDSVQLFESNGELLLATRYYKYKFYYWHVFNKFDQNHYFYWRVYKFDPLRKDDMKHWFTPIESLGNRALSISSWRSDFRRDSVVVVHEAKEFADMIIDGNTTYTRQTDDDRGSIWRKDKDHEWNFMRPSVTYIEPILFA